MNLTDSHVIGRKIQTTSLLFLFGFSFLSCEDFIRVPAPETELVKTNVYKDDATALSAIIGMYSQISKLSSFASGTLSICEGAYADELISYASITSTSSAPAFFFNNVIPTNGVVSTVWGSCYNIIYSSNLIIEGLNVSTTISASVKNQLLGEALFFRAFCHFYLANLFGDVPLITSSDYRINAQASRTSVTNLYQGIISDLLKATELLSDAYPSTGRVRVNKGSSLALLSRAYLYAGEFANAEERATEVINKSTQYKLSNDLSTVFLKISDEAIWQLLPNSGLDTYTYEASVYILVAPPSNVALRDELIDAFEYGDQRKTNWSKSLTSASGFTTWHYAFKYKENYANQTGGEYTMVLRLAEQYLIRAEARIQQDKLLGSNSAESDINIIRSRAGLLNTTAITKDQLLLAVEQERRVELFTEWGHRFFDLKRTGRANQVLQSVKPNWDNTDLLLPIPQSEILINPNLEPQNPGY